MSLQNVLFLAIGRLGSKQSFLFARGYFAGAPPRAAIVGRRSSCGTSAAMNKCIDNETVVQGMLYRIRQVNVMLEKVESELLDFSVDGIHLGEVTPSTADLLVSTGPHVFEYKTAKQQKPFLTLSDAAGTTCESRTAAVESVMVTLREQGIVTGWRDEHYPISHGFYEKPVFGMERAAVPLVGAVEYGVHINGLVTHQDNQEVQMWMARRAHDKSKYPGMLDHVVAGGQPIGLGLVDNVVKECEEEAGIPEEVTRAGIQPAGAISYRSYVASKDVITRAVLFCFDLHLPASFQPVPSDGEVEEFFLWTMDEVKASMAPDFSDPIKPNCYPVIIDYMLRCGHISPEAPGYLDVLRELRSGVCL